MKLLSRTILLFGFLSISAPALAQMHKCRDAQGNIGFSDTPCPATEETLMSSRKAPLSLLAKKLGEAVYTKLKAKADAGNQEAAETLRVMELVESAKVYSLSITIPVAVAGCREVDTQLGEDMETSYRNFLQVHNENIKRGKAVLESGISSTVFPEMNITGKKMQASTDKKIREMQRKYRNAKFGDIRRLARGCERLHKAVEHMAT